MPLAIFFVFARLALASRKVTQLSSRMHTEEVGVRPIRVVEAYVGVREALNERFKINFYLVILGETRIELILDVLQLFHLIDLLNDVLQVSMLPALIAPQSDPPVLLVRFLSSRCPHNREIRLEVVGSDHNVAIPQGLKGQFPEFVRAI